MAGRTKVDDFDLWRLQPEECPHTHEKGATGAKAANLRLEKDILGFEIAVNEFGLV